MSSNMDGSCWFNPDTRSCVPPSVRVVHGELYPYAISSSVRVVPVGRII